MALQVWLPLNGDLHNQGLNQNVTVTSHSATINDSGKIGKCYSFNGSNNYLSCNYNFYNNKYSVSAWIYSTSSTTTQTICCDRTAVGSGFSIFLIGGKIRIDSGGNNLQWTTNYTYPINTWFHLTVAYDGTNVLYYINGKYQEKKAQSISASYWGNIISIGASQANGSNYGNYLNGKLNDIRIYDHALSPKEVEEIAKGLVLHYKLDDQYAEGTTNLCTTGTLSDNYAYNWVTGKYHYGTTTDMYKTTGVFQGRYATKVYMGTDGQSAYPYVFFDHLHPAQNTYKTLSFDYYPTSQPRLIFYTYDGSGTTSYSVNNSPITSGTSIPVKLNTWNHIVFTILGTSSSTSGWGYAKIGSGAHTSTTTDYWLFANIQIEEKDHPTGYAGIGGSRTPTTIYDSSGYSHNGTIVGSLIVAAGSPRYGVATYTESGNTDYIQTPTLNLPGDQITLNFWFKSANQTPGSNYHMPLAAAANSNQAYEMSIYKTGYLRGGLVVAGTRKVDNCTSTKLTDGSWHMCTMTYDGAIIKRYVDAVMEKSTAATGSLVTSTYFALGHYGSNTSYYSKEAYTSDVRIYTTALTEAQVAELYNTSMLVDASGNIMPRGLEEV